MPPRRRLAWGLCALALGLTGCPGRYITLLPVDLAVSPDPTPTPTSAPPATPAPSPRASASASPSPSPAPVPSPSVALPHPDLLLSGRVYDEAGLPVDHCTVTIASLDQYNPYLSTVLASQGRWSVDNFPSQVNYRVTASRTGYTTRTRVGTFHKGQPNVLNFGGPSASEDPVGPAYFISSYPEVEGTSPAPGAEGLGPEATSYQLTLSQALDPTARAAFADALRVFPANLSAAADDTSGGHTTSLYGLPPVGEAGSEDRLRPIEPVAYVSNQAAPVAGQRPWDYALKNNASFLDDPGTHTTVSWDATGRTATLSFNAPLQASHSEGARYQVGLAAAANPIASYGGKPLGIAGQGTLGEGSGTRNFLLHGVFAKGDLALTAAAASEAPPTRRWLQTHEDVSQFSLAPDTTPPRLLAAAFEQLATSSRLALTFSEPLASFNGRAGGHVDRGLATGALLDGLSLAVSDRAGGTAHVPLRGGGSALPYALVPAAGATGSPVPFGASSTRADSLEREFRLAPTGDNASFGQLQVSGSLFAAVPTALVEYATPLASAEAGANRGKVLLAIDSLDPRTLQVYFIQLRHLLDPSLVELKVRAQDVRDSAGNGIPPSAADQQVVTTTLAIAP